MQRRDFLKTAALGLSLAACRRKEGLTCMTVNGPISASDLGLTLTHEHVLVDFIGADQVSPARYDEDEAFRVILPHLQALKKHGVRSFVDCTPAWLGRDARLLRRLTESTGLNMLTNTGYYGARQGKFLPPHGWSESAEELAARWIAEFAQGIEGTGIRPGFIKIGVDDGPLTEVSRKLVRTAALAHLATGLTIAAHTGKNAVFEEIAILQDEGVAPEAFIWVHAQNDPEKHLEVARQGAWVSLDGFRPASLARYLGWLESMRSHRLLHRALLSHDAGWFHVGEPQGGEYRSHEPIFQDLLPALRQSKWAEAEIQQILVANPAECFALRVRPA